MADVGKTQGNQSGSATGAKPPEQSGVIPSADPSLTAGRRVIKVADVPKTQLSDQSGVIVTIKRVKSVFLLPVRYATGWDQSRTPALTSPFHVSDMDASGKDSGKTIAPAPGIHYTLRRLREGYLHVYAGKTLGWRIYRVSDGFGALSLVSDYQAPKYKRRPCDEGIDDPIMPTVFWDRCLLRVPEKTTLWFAFSDVKWTEATMDKAAGNQDNFRDKHMREFKTTGWSGPHVTKLDEMGIRVADFASGMSEKACWFSQEPLERHTFDHYRKTLIEREFLTEKDLEAGAVLALEDSAGIVMDLATSMEARYEQWCGKPDPSCPKRTNEWMMASAQGIELVRQRVEIDAEDGIFDDYRMNYFNDPGLPGEMRYQSGTRTSFRLNVLPYLPERETKPMLERAEKDKKAAWDYCSRKYDRDAYESWMKEFPKRRDDFEKASVWPLARMHVAWTHTARFMAYFMDTFDGAHIDSGLAYAKTLTRCYAGVQNKLPIAKDMDERLSKDLTKENILARAIVLNDEETWNAVIRKSALHGKDPDELPSFPFAKYHDQFWSKVAASLKTTLSVSKKVVGIASKETEFMAKFDLTRMGQAPYVLEALLGTLAGPLGRVAQKQVQNKLSYAALVAKGIIIEPEFRVKVTGNWSELVDVVQQQGEAHIRSLDPKRAAQISADQQRRVSSYVAHKIRDKATSGKAMSTEFYVSAKEYEELLGKAASRKGLKATKGLVLTAEEMQAHTQQRMEVFRKQAGKAAPVAFFRIAGSLLQVVSIGVAVADLAQKGPDQKRCMTAGAAFLTLVSLTGEGLEKTMSTIAKNGISYGAKLANVAKGARWIGRVGTVAAGILTAWIDFEKAGEEGEQGHLIRKRLYQVSGVVGIAGTMTSVLGWIASTKLVGGWLTALAPAFATEVVAGFFVTVGIWIAIVAIAVMILLVLTEPSAIDKFLEFSSWGRNRGKAPYKRMEDELAAIGAAM